jgi:hypothetical protein
VGPRADLKALKMEQFFAIAGDQHTVCLSNPQPNHYIDYTTPPADPQILIPEIISTDKGHAVTLPLSIVIFHHIPLHLLKKAHSYMIPIPDMLFRSDMSSNEGTFFNNICMSIKFSKVTDTGNNNVGHILIYYILNLLFFILSCLNCAFTQKGKNEIIVCALNMLHKDRTASKVVIYYETQKKYFLLFQL